uniref:Putative tail protein n=1 Tax=viral metagenome TaxID=1070528 RepID=A0A6H1ZPY1_9ZZZZ
MARVAGYGGDVLAPGAIVGIREWSIDYAAAALDSSGFDGNQDKTFIAGMKEWSGSFSGFKDGAPLGIGTVIAFEFQESGVATQKWVGNGIITNIRPSSSVDGIVQYAYDFQGTGALGTIPTT